MGGSWKEIKIGGTGWGEYFYGSLCPTSEKKIEKYYQPSRAVTVTHSTNVLDAYFVSGTVLELEYSPEDRKGLQSL